MYSEIDFVTNCIEFLLNNSYEDYEDVKPDIELYVKSNLPSDLQSLEFETQLCGTILTEYIKYDYDNSSSVEELDDAVDDILFQSVEVWLAAHDDNSMRQYFILGG